MAEIKHASSASFAADVIEASSAKLVLVDFWAEWCGPCKAIAPVLEELAANNPDNLQVVKVDVDQHGDSAQSHHVSGIPTLLLFKEGKEVAREVGAQQLASYQAMIDTHKF